MSEARGNYYYPRGLRRSPSSLFVCNTHFNVRKKPFAQGYYGFVFNVNKIHSAKETTNIIVKKVSLDFYNLFKNKYPDASEEYLQYLREQTLLSEFDSVKRETFIFKTRYGFGELFYVAKEWSARIVLLKLPGISLNNYYFDDLLEFLSLWIKTQIEIHFLHTQFGIVHGDLKRSNVLYDNKTGNIFLCDFGLARRIGEITSGKWSETSPHLHPALASAPLAEPYFDVFSLGDIVKDFDQYHTLYNEKAIKKPLAHKPGLKEIIDGMTNLNPKKQWTLPKAIDESIKFYNIAQKDPSKHMSRALKDYQPSPLIFTSESIMSVRKQAIPNKALFPIDLSDQLFTRQVQENKEIKISLEKLEKKDSPKQSPATPVQYKTPAPGASVEKNPHMFFNSPLEVSVAPLQSSPPKMISLTIRKTPTLQKR
jgi:serine/threonine protein kinase